MAVSRPFYHQEDFEDLRKQTMSGAQVSWAGGQQGGPGKGPGGLLGVAEGLGALHV